MWCATLDCAIFMPPTSKKLTGHIDFGLSVRPSIRSSRTVHARVLIFHTWVPHEKQSWYTFLFLYVLSPFLELCPSEKKIKMKSDACHILCTVHARALKFHIWIPHGKKGDPFIFLSELSPFLELCPFEKIRMKSCQQYISKTRWAIGLNLGQLIGDDK